MNRYVIIVSLILNAILLSFLFGLVPFLLYVSVVINGFLIWYSINVVAQNNEIQEDLNRLSESLDYFCSHIEDIHSLEMFYGDETLQSLIEHSRQTINKTIDFQEKYFDIEVVETDDSEDPEAPASQEE